MTVVVKRNSFTPSDAIVGYPGLFPPKVDVIDVSCVFTWDKLEAIRISESWKDAGYKVNLGGPAFDDPGGEFIPGKFIKVGVTITSRGCVRNCPFCYVPKREGNKIRHLVIHPGNIVNDNNLLACNRKHVEQVFDMLKIQRAIEFKGGIDSRLLKDWHIEGFRSLRIKEIWLAADSLETLPITVQAIQKLKAAGFSQYKIRCYVLIGFGSESIDTANERLKTVFQVGAYPFAQLYDGKIPTKEWKQFTRKWSRPAIMKKMMQGEML